MKKLLVLLALILILAACQKQDILNHEAFKDIKKAEWSCAHGAEGRKIQIIDNELIIDNEISEDESYHIQHLEDMLFEIKNKGSTKILRLDPETKGIHIFEKGDDLKTLKPRPLDHECELIEKIES